MKDWKKPGKLLLLILLATFILRLVNINFPKSYLFDEVYHAFTAQEMLKWNPKAWEWWNPHPTGVAYEWTHPPLAKEMMALSMGLLQSMDGWAWRIPGVILGTVSVYLLYLIAKKLFENERVSLLAAFLFSIDGLNFVQSRTGMNDIYLITGILFSVLFFLNKRFVLSAIFVGVALASKWSAFYLIGMLGFLLFIFKQYKKILYFLIIPPIVYFLTYLPFFGTGHNLEQFKGVQQQMWWYHTGLDATHGYTSPWWSWPINLKPVWYFVDYQDNYVASVFASGNPILFYLGLISIVAAVVFYLRKPSASLFVVILGYVIFLLPWAMSPRIMFLYHYSPSVPFMCLSLAYFADKFIGKSKRLLYLFLGLVILGFILVYPFLVGIPLPKQLLGLIKITYFSLPF